VTRFPAFAEEEAAAALFDGVAVVGPQPERERRVDQRGAFAGQVMELEASTVVVEEAGQGLRAPLADVGVGAEGQPRLGHALEAAERLVGNPRQDSGEDVGGEAPERVLFLLLLVLQIVGTVRLGSGFPVLD
jgi:hypothetical protein